MLLFSSKRNEEKPQRHRPTGRRVSVVNSYKIPNIDFYFWRESNENEIDCLADIGNKLKVIEIKSA